MHELGVASLFHRYDRRRHILSSGRVCPLRELLSYQMLVELLLRVLSELTLVTLVQ